MTTLAPRDYLDHLQRESRRFRDVLAGCRPDARVPGCPDWAAADLLWHLTEVQWFWATRVRDRPAPPSHERGRPERPNSYAELLAAFDEHSAALSAQLAAADPAEPAWTWSAEQTVGFSYRRQAHEALIHRLDAEQTAGTVTPLDPALAADGVLECLDIMFGASPAWGEFHPLPTHVRVDCTDTGDRIWVQLGRFVGTHPENGRVHDDEDLSVVADPGSEPDAVVEGSAADLDAWLWRRLGDDAAITVRGDREVFDRFRATIDHPID